MDFKTESIRLAGSRKMDIPSLARDIEMALENAADDANSVIRRIAALSKERMGLRLPKDPLVAQINEIANDYLRSK